MKRITTEQLFRAWGRDQQHLPLHAGAVRENFLTRVSSFPRAEGRSIWVVPAWLVPAACAGFAVLVFVLMPGHLRPVDVLTESTATLKTGAVPLQGQEQITAPTAPQAFSKSAAMGAIAPEEDRMALPPVTTTPTVSDTREFLKIGYSASVQTQSVSKAGERVEVLVRGFGGRVDSASYSSESGYMSFVVPQDKFSQFRLALREAVGGERFVFEHTNSENLLGQKQGLETEQTRTLEHLAELRTRLQSLASEHGAKVAALETEQRQNKSEQATVIEMERLHPEQATVLVARLETLRRSARVISNTLAAEQSSFSAQQNSLETEIRAAEQTARDLQGQTTELLEQVATVSGSVTLERIGLLSFLDAYIYFRWTLPAVLLLFGLIYFLRAKRTSLLIV